jgi:hypothetical protein
MAIVVKFAVSGMSAEKYQAGLRELEASGAGVPPGRLYHVSYGPPHDLQVIDVFDSQMSFENFGKTLVPILERLGIKAQPDVSQVYRIIKG